VRFTTTSSHHKKSLFYFSITPLVLSRIITLLKNALTKNYLFLGESSKHHFSATLFHAAGAAKLGELG